MNVIKEASVMQLWNLSHDAIVITAAQLSFITVLIV